MVRIFCWGIALGICLESFLSYCVYPWLLILILCTGVCNRIFCGVGCVGSFAALCDGLGSFLLCVPFCLVFFLWCWYVGGGICCCGLKLISCCCLFLFLLRFASCFWPCGQVIRRHCPFSLWCVFGRGGGIWVFCHSLWLSPFWSSLRWCLRVLLLVALLPS